MERTSTLALMQQVAQLHDLRQGPAVYGALVAAGAAAVAPLEALLRGATETVTQPRQQAAEILADIAACGEVDAVAALRRALADSLSRHLSPELQDAEDLIGSVIARRLGVMADVDAAPLLLRGLRQRRLPGCAAALGALRHAPAIPALIECLEDDVARADAMAALRDFGPAVTPTLIGRLRQCSPADGATQALARVCAAELLGVIGGVPARRALRTALDDAQPGVRSAAAVALAQSAREVPSEAVVQRLIEALDARELWVSNAAEATLRRHAKALRPRLQTALLAASADAAGRRRAADLKRLLR